VVNTAGCVRKKKTPIDPNLFHLWWDHSPPRDGKRSRLLGQPVFHGDAFACLLGVLRDVCFTTVHGFSSHKSKTNRHTSHREIEEKKRQR
jgi:hypothetical protein